MLGSHAPASPAGNSLAASENSPTHFAVALALPFSERLDLRVQSVTFKSARWWEMEGTTHVGVFPLGTQVLKSFWPRSLPALWLPTKGKVHGGGNVITPAHCIYTD